MADEFPGDLPITPGITVGDWRRAQALKTDQSAHSDPTPSSSKEK